MNGTSLPTGPSESPGGSGAPGTSQVLATRDAAEAARSIDLVLAHLHLRLGSLALARAELETLAGRDALDEAGLVDLAEARWRTGDMAGAGEAATAVLDEDGAGPLTAMVVAAEAATLRGRPSEARRHAERALGAAGTSSGGIIDALFAGMPRGPVWPADATTVTLPAPTLFDVPRARAGAPAAPGFAADASRAHDPGPDGPVLETPPAESREPATIALWDTIEAPPPELHDPEPDLPSGDAALHAGGVALAAGDIAAAAAHLALVLRVTPALAPAVLDAIEGHPDRALAFVRGDAFRLVGRERDARRAFADAVDPIAPAEPSTDQPPEGDLA
jgi:hypothetical protein